MPVTLDRLPFDVLYWITAGLSFDDIVQLGLTCRQLRHLLDEDTLYRRTVESLVSYSKEARLAQANRISYRDAFHRIRERREAFANAYPYSARIVGQGQCFLYREGILCVLQRNVVRASDLHASSGASWEIDLAPILDSVASPGSSCNEKKINLLHYNDNILAIHCERKGRPGNSWLFAISTDPNVVDNSRLLKTVELESSNRLFARHNASFLYWGTHSGTGGHGHREWRIQGVSLDPANDLLTEAHPLVPPLQLEDFVGTDIGSTIVFEIHNGYFYALSNQSTFDVEEVDWTSFYHCVRFPLERPIRDALSIDRRIYRRQHAEGPINDSWTYLSLQVDECTNDLVIVESRREWLNGASKQHRTFYTKIIEFPETEPSSPLSADGLPASNSSNGPRLPENDIYLSTLTSDNNPNWAPTQPRYARYMHLEYGIPTDTARSFILARTKFRAYNLSCSSFLDLVEDEKCCISTGSAGSCLRLRIGSRRQASSREDSGPAHYREIPRGKVPHRLSSEQFRYSPIRLWPSPASYCSCAAKLHRILNPAISGGSGYSKTLVGSMDERSLVYMIRPGRPSFGDEDSAVQLGRIVLIGFDREIGRSMPVVPTGAGVMPSSNVSGMVEEELHWRWEPRACQNGACR